MVSAVASMSGLILAKRRRRWANINPDIEGPLRSARWYTVDLVIFARFLTFFANIARRLTSRIQESHGNYYYNSASKENWKFVKSKLLEKSPKIKNRENLLTRKLP